MKHTKGLWGFLFLGTLACAPHQNTDELDNGKSHQTESQDPIDNDSPKTPTFKDKTVKPIDNSHLINIPNKHKKLLKNLGDPKNAAEAVSEIVKLGDDVVPDLVSVTKSSKDTVVCGWALKALSQIETETSAKALQDLSSDSKLKPVVQTWAAAAIVAQAKTIDEVLALSDLLVKHPALTRPIKMKLQAYKDNIKNVGEAIAMANKNTAFQSILAPLIMEKSADDIIKAMFTNSDMNVRRSAAGYLAGMARTDVKVIDKLVESYKFDTSAATIPWDGGPLYIPSSQFGQTSARSLVRSLISWHLFCDRKGLGAEKNQINNNLRSVGISRTAGLQNSWNLPKDTDGLLVLYGRNFGTANLREMLKEQDPLGVEKYKSLLERVESGK